MKKIEPVQKRMFEKMGQGMGKLTNKILRTKNVKVRADAERNEELGTPNFFGNVHKR